MAKIRKIHVPAAHSERKAPQKFDFVFSSDIAKWMPRVKAQRPDKRVRHGEFGKRVPAKGKMI